MKPTILLDMDEVCVDFTGGACKVHGLTRPEMYEKFGTFWTGSEFWSPIQAKGVAFWVELEPLPWFTELIHLVEQNSREWHFVTDPTALFSDIGKIVWLENYFGKDFDQYVLTIHKHLLAKRRTLLIDDRESNIRKFLKDGGDALLFPSHTNSLKDHIKDPISHLSMSLQSYLGE